MRPNTSNHLVSGQAATERAATSTQTKEHHLQGSKQAGNFQFFYWSNAYTPSAVLSDLTVCKSAGYEALVFYVL